MTERPLRVMQLVGNLERGGGQEVVRTLVRHLPDADVEPIVVTLSDGPLRSEIERQGIPVEVVAGRRHGVAAGTAALRELRRIRTDLADVVHRHRVSVIQTHLLRSLDFLALSLRGGQGADIVFWTMHNAMLELRADQLPGSRLMLRPKRAAHRMLYRLGARTVDGFIAVSTDVGNAVREAYRPSARRLTVIPNGVDIERYGEEVDRSFVRSEFGIAGDAPVAIVVAKLMEQKGHSVLLDAIPAVLAHIPRLEVLLVGEGELRPSLEARAAQMGIGANLHFAGNRADIPALLAASDLFVLPSRWEGLPMALLEAMAAGLPLVASSVSGTREVVEHSTSGLLVPPDDSSALARAMVKILADPVAADAMGRAARARVDACYSARAQARRHAALYRSRLAARRGERV